MTERGWYSLIQYCPDPGRAEAVNVGVALLGESGLVETRVSRQTKRAKGLFGSEIVEPARLRAMSKSVAEHLKFELREDPSLERLNHFIKTRGNEFRLTAPRSVAIDEAAETIERLYARLVDTVAALNELPSTQRAVKETFSLLIEKHRAQEVKRYPVPGSSIKIHSDYKWQNGELRVVVIRPYQKTGNAEYFVLHQAAEAEYLWKQSREHNCPAKLDSIVIAEDAEADIDEGALRDLYKDRAQDGGRLIVPSGVEEYLRTVEREAKPLAS